MYVETPESAKKLLQTIARQMKTLEGIEVVVAPPFTLLSSTAQTLKRSSVRVAAQTLAGGAGQKHTGAVSGTMLKAVGASAVIVGHSERRVFEDSNAVRAQVVQALASGLVVVLCVGEAEHDASGAHVATVAAQLTSALNDLPKGASSKIVIAYEPVWAIGKSAAEAMQPADLEEMSIFIRKTLTDIFDRASAARVPILYGGSVDASNAGDLMLSGGIAGFLVGRASVDPQEFITIARIVESTT